MIMRVKKLITERFQDYKVPSMYIGCVSCDGKCCLEAGVPIEVCINDQWRKCDAFLIDDRKTIEAYLNDPITAAVIFAGLEPFEQFDEVLEFTRILREEYHCDDDVVIYTGYNKAELTTQIKALSEYKNIVIKFGRYKPGIKSRFDPVLGVTLASENQYAEKIS